MVAHETNAGPGKGHLAPNRLGRMRTRFFIAVVACCALTTTGIAAAAGRKADTGDTIKAGGTFHGKVLSERASCEAPRKVFLFRQSGKHQNPSKDQKVLSTTSERQGNKGVWAVSGSFAAGKFYAKAKGTSKCAAGFSKTINVAGG